MFQSLDPFSPPAPPSVPASSPEARKRKRDGDDELLVKEESNEEPEETEVRGIKRRRSKRGVSGKTKVDENWRCINCNRSYVECGRDRRRLKGGKWFLFFYFFSLGSS